MWRKNLPGMDGPSDLAQQNPAGRAAYETRRLPKQRGLNLGALRQRWLALLKRCSAPEAST